MEAIYPCFTWRIDENYVLVSQLSTIDLSTIVSSRAQTLVEIG
jgi:hypothetical protein